MQLVKRQTMRAQIAATLRAAVLSAEFPPGTQIVEAELAQRFGVSRGPLREALRELIEEGLLISIPYSGTRVAELSVQDIDDVFSLRTELEIFAFRRVWPLRDVAYRTDLTGRHAALKSSVSAGDEEGAILAELALHSHVYERCNHPLLLQMWGRLAGKLQLYWAAHHHAHGRRAPRLNGHEAYVSCALGDDLDAMEQEVSTHMLHGFEKTRAFLIARGPAPETLPRSERHAP